MSKSLVAKLLAVACFSYGCDDKPVVTADAGTEDAGPKPALGGKLGQAMKAAESARPQASGSAADGPPPNGIFASGNVPISDKVPPKLEVFSEGADPRIALTPDWTTEQKFPLTIVLTQGRQAVIPPMELDLVIGAKTADKKAEGPAPAATAAAATSSGRIAARVTDARLPGADNYPKELSELPKKLKGAVIEFSVSAAGPVDFSSKLAKADANLEKDLHLPMRIIEEALNGLYIPTPDKPVGEGAYWMVGDRHPSLGVDVVRYRVFRVAKVFGDRANISIEIRQYAASDAFNLPLGPQMSGMNLVQYNVTGKGIADLTAKSLFPSAAGFGLRTEAALASTAAQGGKQAVLALEITAQLGKEAPQGAEQAGPGR